jgi:dTDP-3-amino-3,4,6-trideoxy-alpha-D-glucose transaminase
MTVPYFDLSVYLRSRRPDLEATGGRCHDSGTFCLWPEVKQFECELAAFCGAGHCVAIKSGTSALHGAMRLLDLGQGDEVSLPMYPKLTDEQIGYVAAAIHDFRDR